MSCDSRSRSRIECRFAVSGSQDGETAIRLVGFGRERGISFPNISHMRTTITSLQILTTIITKSFSNFKVFSPFAIVVVARTLGNDLAHIWHAPLRGSDMKKTGGQNEGKVDCRIAAFFKALDVLCDGQASRAGRIVTIFSDHTVELPRSAVGVKGTTGVAKAEGIA